MPLLDVDVFTIEISAPTDDLTPHCIVLFELPSDVPPSVPRIYPYEPTLIDSISRIGVFTLTA